MAAVRLDFLARDKASTTIARIDQRIGDLGVRVGGVMRGIGMAAGGVAVAGVVALGGALVEGARAAARYETLGAKTAAVIESTGNVANISVAGVQNLAGELESLSGVDEELIINSQNVLATFTQVRNEVGKGNDIFNQGTEAALNMSVALGQDLQSASLLVGKALNDPVKGVTALRRAGVQLTEAQTDQVAALVATGDVMGAQKIILAELETQFGGTAEAAGSGFEGSLARAQDAAADLGRDIGAELLPHLTELADWFARDGANAIESYASWVINTGVPGLVSAFSTAKTGVTGVLSSLFGDVDLTSVGTSLLERGREMATGVIGGITTGLETGDWSPLGIAVGEMIGNAIMSGADLTARILTWIGSVDWVKVGIEAGGMMIPFAVGIVTGLINSLTDPEMWSMLASNWEAIALAALGAAFMPAKWGTAILNVLRRIPFVGRMVSWFAGGFISVSRSVVGTAGRFVGDIFGAVGRGIVGPGGVATIGRFTTWLRNFPERITQAAAGVAFAAGRMIGRLRDAILGGAERVGSAIGRVTGWITSPFKHAGTWLVGVGSAIIGGLVDGITSGFSHVEDALGWLTDRIPSWKGPAQRDARLLEPAGQIIVDGLIAGMESRYPAVQRTLERLTSQIGSTSPHMQFAQDLLGAIRSGKRIEEDFAWSGMSDRWTDDIRQKVMKMFYAANPGWDHGVSTGFNQKLTAVLQSILASGFAVQPGIGTPMHPGARANLSGGGGLVLELHTGGGGTSIDAALRSWLLEQIRIGQIQLWSGGQRVRTRSAAA